MMTATRRLTFPALLAAFVIGLAGIFADTRGYASEIKYIVNDVPVTSYDIARRAAFLKLQRRD